jgi:hypothetical protein
MSQRATGSFEVTIVPQADPQLEGSTLARMLLDKRFHGDLEAGSKGQMLTAGAVVKGSAVYVAVEEVSGTLHGRRGSFALHHSGIMTRGAPDLVIAVVPDSGTGELAGLSGRLSISINDGRHFYEFDYTLP